MSVILKVDTRSRAAKAFLSFVKTLSFVKVEEPKEKEKRPARKSPYDPKFVEKIRRAEKEESITVDPNDLWGSLGLK